MPVPEHHSLTDLDALHLAARSAEIATSEGGESLLLDGLALLTGCHLQQGTIEVDIAAEGEAYSGIVFRATDTLNYELAYAQPHTSEEWDSLQYDPVFHGANTWQIYHGEAYQRQTQVPTGRWFTLRVTFQGCRARISVDEQAPLVIERLAHGQQGGMVGVWSYLPAYFRNLRISASTAILEEGREADQPLDASWQRVHAWFVEGLGATLCEANGALNLHRYLPASMRGITLSRRLAVTSETQAELAFGFSDVIDLALDGETIYQGRHTFSQSPEWCERGYVIPEQRLKVNLTPGEHRLSALVQVNEPFGWGLVLALRGEGIELLPPEWS